MTDAPKKTFHFRAAAPEGGVFAGQLLATSERDALQQLSLNGYLPLRLEAKPIAVSILDREVAISASKVLTLRDCETFCRELSIILSSGLELIDATSIMAPSLPRGSRLRRFCLAMQRWLRMGRGFSQAIVETGFACPTDFVAVVRVGEETGNLPAVLGMLADAYGESGKFERLLVGALIYPVFLLVVAIAVIGIIAFYVAPSMTGLFESMDRPTPQVIAALDATATFLSGNVGLVLPIAGGVIILGAIATSRTGFRRIALSCAFALPIVGSALVWSASRRFASTLRLYVASNVPMAAGLPNAFTAAGFPNGPQRAAKLSDAVRCGARLADALGELRIVPEKIIHLIRVGENSGRLVDVLTAIADEAKLRFERQVVLMSALLAPILIVAVGGVIGTIIFSVFSALLEINNLAV